MNLTWGQCRPVLQAADKQIAVCVSVSVCLSPVSAVLLVLSGLLLLNVTHTYVMHCLAGVCVRQRPTHP